MQVVPFHELNQADLVVDTVYKGGTMSGKGAEVLHKLLPNCSNSGGFRKVMRKSPNVYRQWEMHQMSLYGRLAAH